MSEFENQTFNTNGSFIAYEKCHVRLVNNYTSKDTASLIKYSACTNGYEYNLDKESTFVTEVLWVYTVLSSILSYFVKVSSF